MRNVGLLHPGEEWPTTKVLGILPVSHHSWTYSTSLAGPSIFGGGAKLIRECAEGFHFSSKLHILESVCMCMFIYDMVGA